MSDPRIQKLAKVLVDYSTRIKKGDNVAINFGSDSKELALEVYRLVIRRGAYPKVNANLPGFGYAYLKYASPAQFKKFPELAMHEAKYCNKFISIGADYNTKEFSNIDPKKITFRSKVTRPISDVVLKKQWVICEFPTNALAQDADMSLEEFEDFVYNACLVDWRAMAKKQDKLKKIVDNGENVRIVGDETDITFSIKGRKAIRGDGTHNMPDGEVFTAPVDKSAEGYIAYTYPVIKMGKEVDGIKLEFKNGRVINFSATKNESLLKAALNTDKGARYLGELGIGMNYNIKRFIKQILFDEKIGGTIHLALGMAYKECGGKNKSAIHWDMIKDLRRNGKLYIDNKLVQKNGRFLI